MLIVHWLLMLSCVAAVATDDATYVADAGADSFLSLFLFLIFLIKGTTCPRYCVTDWLRIFISMPLSTSIYHLNCDLLFMGLSLLYHSISYAIFMGLIHEIK